MHRNDDSGAPGLVQQIALTTIRLSNRTAWREIEALLLNAGLSRRRVSEAREAVWRERHRIRAAGRDTGLAAPDTSRITQRSEQEP